MDGLRTYWHENGQKASELSYNCGKLHGIYMEWHENGHKEQEGNFNRDGHGDILARVTRIGCERLPVGRQVSAGGF